MKKLSKIVDAINVGSNQMWNQLIKYIGVDQPLPIPRVSSVTAEKVVSTSLLKPTARKINIQFNTRRNWQPMDWKL
ncbi:MAG: hypothetical protein JSV73_05890 [Flavobacteriaceae bacterium]|nr:MAG: hypothetical protein JSV73_05890 [Flavobacteriaceae bacterium]